MIYVQMKITQVAAGMTGEQWTEIMFPDGELTEFLKYLNTYNEKTKEWLEVPG